MITNSDLNISNQSYTKKDFYQIYPELTSLVKELTNVWNPEDTNESDPGVILLKIAAFVADKLNYNIDKNILETFITSATQEQSMRKLCDMMGYNMKYYNSATTNVSFMWTTDTLAAENQPNPQWTITLPKFTTVITNDAKDINFVLTENVYLTNRYKTVTARAIQGDLVKLDINDNGILLVSNIDDKNRFYLPESQIAENGIWIYDHDTYSTSGVKLEWQKTDNLNTEILGKRVWKFGYDSIKQLPYIEFPSDYVNLFNSGLDLYYVRTSGNDGNIKASTLTTLVNNSLTAVNIYTDETLDVSAENNLIIKNLYSTIDGRDKETIDEAYEGFKKTIGTFDTLVTCRDYANAIYNMVFNEYTDNTPLVSNCQVSDIRDELNYSTTVVEYNDLGKTYVNKTETDWIEGQYKVNKTDTSPQNGYIEKPLLTDFDLYIYPLNSIKNAYTEATYKKSFQALNPSADDTYTQIMDNLRDYKTISHTIKQFAPNAEDAKNHLYLIKAYYSLKAKIVTKNKVNTIEANNIKNNIFTALYKNFNARQLEYGEEIPYERLLSVIENADSRIKAVSLNEPDINLSYMMASNDEKPFKFTEYSGTEVKNTGTELYEKMVAKNILAGKIPLFDYNTNIVNTFHEINSTDDKTYGSIKGNSYAQGKVAKPTVDNSNSITYFDSEVKLNTEIGSGDVLELQENEMIQIVSPKLLTEVTYPMYIIYAIYLQNDTKISKNSTYILKPASGDLWAESLFINYTDNTGTTYWIQYTNDNGKFKKYIWTQKDGTPKVEDWSGIIQPNFELSSTTVTEGKAVKTGWPSAWDTYLNPIGGMPSLKTSSEIAIKNINSASIKQVAYIYWLSNNNNKIILQREDKATRRYSYILNDGEYFFYTNQAKTDLVTLGSGTKLIYYATESEASSSSIVWDLHNEQSITSDDVAQNGIGAFANSDWIVEHWTEDNYLETQQLNIITLSEKDKINSWQFETKMNKVGSSWVDLKSIDYSVYNEADSTYDLADPIISNDIIKYKLRTVLNLSFGPNKTQNLLKDNTHEQSIKFYTSGYTKDGVTFLTNAEVINALQSDPSSIREIIVQLKEFNTTTGIKSNMTIEKSGGQSISLHTINLNGGNKDNVLVYPLTTKNIEPTLYIGGTTETFDPINNGISLSDLSTTNDYALLPIYIPENNYALLTLYIVSTNETDKKPQIEIYKNTIKESGEESGETEIECLQVYPEIYEPYKLSLQSELHNGLNIIKINNVEGIKDYTLKISNPYGSTSKINIFGVKLVNVTGIIDIDESGESGGDGNVTNNGLNNELFGIPTKYVSNFFKTHIKEHNKFYATTDIDNNMLIDVKTMADPLVVFNYNNEINKYVLCELDCDSFKNIEISSSSKL